MGHPAQRTSRPVRGRPGRPRRGLRVTLALAVAAAGAVVVAARTSPWLSALLIRSAFDRGGRASNAALAPLVPTDVTSVLDVRYGPGRDALLDVHRPAGATGPLPTIVWVHGGGWVSGDKSQVAGYLTILAGRGFTVVGVNYPIAPEATYPAPLVHVARALGHLTRHADELHVDPDALVLAGDSAGAQIAAQVACAVTSPEYAQRLDLGPLPTADRLRGTLLHCGAYDMSMVQLHGAAGWFLRTVLWSYTGTRDFLGSPDVDPASVRRHVTAQFPPTFLTGGNGDPLTPQSRAMAQTLRDLGVEVETLLVPQDRTPPLRHEFQLDLTTPEAQDALERSVAFVRDVTAPRGD